MTDTRARAEQIAAGQSGSESEFDALAAEIESALRAERRKALERESRLEDAAFHFQTCRVCKTSGDDACPSGRQFAAFLRGSPDA